MATRLPSLSALRVFEAASRHANFSRAADELHITHGAVSHQIKSLEQELGATLFTRGRRGVALTPEGTALAAVMRDALGRIAQGVEAVRGRSPRALTVSVLPAFATHWLIPRLADFQARHPEIEVNIRASQELVDFGRDDVDVAVRYGPGTWRGLGATRLMGEQVFPVCSPDFAGGRLPRSVEALTRAKLLHSPTQPWDTWFRALGVSPPPERRGPNFSEAGLLLRAAVDGLGVALARSVLARPDLEAGRLVRPVPESVPADYAYYIVHPAGVPVTDALAAFKTWLMHLAGEADCAANRMGTVGSRSGAAAGTGDEGDRDGTRIPCATRANATPHPEN
jgi:LysR family transcriptional regulator, glycine cleavage system transcriptional activator